jgi:hypothetical protein
MTADSKAGESVELTAGPRAAHSAATTAGHSESTMVDRMVVPMVVKTDGCLADKLVASKAVTKERRSVE